MTPQSRPTPVRLALLVSWQERGRWFLLRRLRQRGLEVDVLCPWFLGGPRLLARASIWLSRFYLPLAALARPGRYDVLTSWNLPCATVLGLGKRLLGRLPPLPVHLARDFHIDPGRADQPGYALKLRLLKMALPGIDLALTTSQAEEAVYAALFRQKSELFTFFPDAPPSELFDEPALPCAGHVFAYGNSDRDFDALIAAAALLDAPVELLSQTYVPKGPLPANVVLTRDYVPRQELVRRIAAARCCVVPLRDYRVAAGQNSMFEVMALGRPLVIADNIAIAQYVVPGRNALVYPPGDAVQLASQIRFFLENPNTAEACGREAKRVAREWLERQVDCFLQILDSVVPGGKPRCGAVDATPIA